MALALALGPRFYSGLAGPGKKLFDRQNPREFSETLKKADLDEKVSEEVSSEELKVDWGLASGTVAAG